MDHRLLEYYERELQHIREMGGEFARQFPKIAGRLGLDAFECADPYVERLLEGFAFLAARIHLRLDAEFPIFTQHLLEVIYPHYLAPVPSMAVVEFHPDLRDPNLGDGFTIPRGTALRSLLSKDEQTACEYSTGQEVTLWPLKLQEVEYFSRDVASIGLPPDLRDEVRAGLRIRLQVTAGLDLKACRPDRLTLYLRGREELPVRLYQQLMADAVAVWIVPPRGRPEDSSLLPPSSLQPRGFGEDENLLKMGARTFSGYRLLAEYFAFHQRFLFVQLSNLQPALSRHGGQEIDIVVLFNRADAALENVVTMSNIALNCAPVVNLFSRMADTIHLDTRDFEYHVVPDRTRPMDLEVYSVESVVGRGVDVEDEQQFLPLYGAKDSHVDAGHQAYYTLRRTPRLSSQRQRAAGPRSSYIGSEIFLMLVDARNAPYRHDLRTLSVGLLCTNRDLPLMMPIGKADTDFTLQVAAPVVSIRCVAGPTPPRPSLCFAPGELVWRLVSHLSLNYLSLVDTQGGRGAAALRDLLRLYCDSSDAGAQRQIEGVRQVHTRPILRRLPLEGPMTMGRGLEVTLELDEEAFQGCGVFLLAAVLEQFFSRYVAINSFTETVLRTNLRQEVMRWPIRIGQRHIL